MKTTRKQPMILLTMVLQEAKNKYLHKVVSKDNLHFEIERLRLIGKGLRKRVVADFKKLDHDYILYGEPKTVEVKELEESWKIIG